MNRIRRKRIIFPALGLWLAAGVVGTSAPAQDSLASPAAAVSGRRAVTDGPPLATAKPSVAASDSKVHGTITVDFDKVTINELLRLVDVVEKVDGVIHIVSSKAGDGVPALVVTGSRGTLALTRPDSPTAPKLVVGPPRDGEGHPQRMSSALQAFSTASMPEFPRLAALGRFLGIARRTTGPNDRRETVADALPRHNGRNVVPLESPRPEPSSIPVGASSQPWLPSTALNPGSHIEALASGQPTVVKPIHSPWPTPSADEVPVSPQDFDVSRTGRDEEAVAKAAPQRHLAAKGETFDGLARRFYGDGRYAWALWWANRDRVTWPDALTAGKALVVPGLGDLDPKMVMTQSTPSNDAVPRLEPIGPRRDQETVRASFNPTPVQSTESTESGGFAVHIVRPDDTLRIIAREKCGDERKALDIMALNRDALSREGRPRVGQCLILPAPSTETANRAPASGP
ncbi:LysM peptidoglycan-binding domain-containing protein [Paludisphaera mucosa]|uniref:LysM peptidoglycan-binding domain-containing protein n=1 Tax=Paludisphaera mucosa TaxID=3030827 RepID=A0ABT6F7I0_9BACT|nr:LysM peptidoglycan-binding domain-containing protein [Paludisphaera mucosa]MDG3003528.1 LysM peptidoglycan-binding domain-containing protein [Paludisphaera mucosa]